MPAGTDEIDATRQAAGETTPLTAEPPILFFDGVCGLCSQAVDFVILRDRRHRIRFAPLQGETALRLLGAQAVQKLNTMIYVDGVGRHERSDAAIRILHELGGGWSWCGRLLWLVPKPLRNLGYFLVASQRYRLFGKKETCRMPRPEERPLFLP